MPMVLWLLCGLWFCVCTLGVLVISVYLVGLFNLVWCLRFFSLLVLLFFLVCWFVACFLVCGFAATVCFFDLLLYLLLFCCVWDLPCVVVLFVDCDLFVLWG